MTEEQKSKKISELIEKNIKDWVQERTGKGCTGAEFNKKMKELNEKNKNKPE